MLGAGVDASENIKYFLIKSSIYFYTRILYRCIINALYYCALSQALVSFSWLVT